MPRQYKVLPRKPFTLRQLVTDLKLTRHVVERYREYTSNGYSYVVVHKDKTYITFRSKEDAQFNVDNYKGSVMYTVRG